MMAASSMDLQSFSPSELGGDAPESIAMMAAGSEGPESEAMMALQVAMDARLHPLAEDDAPEAAISTPAHQRWACDGGIWHRPRTR